MCFPASDGALEISPSLISDAVVDDHLIQYSSWEIFFFHKNNDFSSFKAENCVSISSFK